ncbi:MAG: hypothetical protein PHC90_05200 [Syntrophorhabdaceae bacterium]|nr:hypothetical protein [Syntrophorhabdaceae bacterium]
MKTGIERDIIYFEGMTLAALGQEDGAAFIRCLLEREKVCGRLAASSKELDADAAERFYNNETRVVERLEEERLKLLMEIGQYSQNRRALRSYSPKFPLPPVPFIFSVEK